MPKVKTKSELETLSTHELVYELLAERVGAIDPKDVFFAKKIESGKDAGKWSAILGGKKLTPNQIVNLREEAKTLQSMELWKIITQTLAHEANLRMFKGAKTTEDMYFGKAILHAISVLETIVESIKAEHA